MRRLSDGANGHIWIAVVVLVVLGNAAAGQTTDAPLAEAGIVGAPVGGMDFESLSLFQLGRSVFQKEFTVSGEGNPAFDGLGPLMNASSCAACHANDGRGAPPEADDGSDFVSGMVLQLAAEPTESSNAKPYGRQLQDMSIPGHSPEGRIEVEYSARPFFYPDGESLELRVPQYSVAGMNYGPLGDDVIVLPRVASPIFGAGLLAMIPDDVVASMADPDDANVDGISGRSPLVVSPSLGKPAPGRFGWKAAKATIQDQVAEALSLDMGLSSPLSATPAGDCTPSQSACVAAPTGESGDFEDLEVHSDPFSWLVHYSSTLDAPASRAPALDAEASALFSEVGCASCHVPSYDLPPDAGEAYFRGVHIRPYTDLLLHDMGEGLADPVGNHGVTAGEWRTPPLWGVGLSGQINGNVNFLHDGRARTIEEAILWHAGEAEASRYAFVHLPNSQRELLLKFVSSL